MQLSRIKTIGAKVESVYGQPESVGAADMFYVYDLNLTLNFETTERQFLKTSFSPIAPINTAGSGTIDFKTELVGSGVAGTAPFDDALLRGAGYTPTVVGGTSVTYAPTSLNQEGVTIWVYEDGVLKKFWGCRGNKRIVIPVNQHAYCEWHFEALNWSMEDATLVEGSNYSTTVPPVGQNMTITFDGYTFILPELSFDTGNTLALSRSLGAANGIERVMITNRVPMLTFDAESVTLGEFDFNSYLTNSTEAVFNAVLGSSAGNIITLNAPKASMKMSIAEGDRDGIQTIPISIQCNRNTGDDEITIKYT